MDKQLTFPYRGQTYQTTIVVSKEKYPHYYWCLLYDAELISDLGDDCVGFKRNEDGVLYPSGFYPGYYQDLVDQLQLLVIQEYQHLEEHLWIPGGFSL